MRRQQAQWQQRMQKKEAKPTREEQEKRRRQAKDRAQDVRRIRLRSHTHRLRPPSPLLWALVARW